MNVANIKKNSLKKSFIKLNFRTIFDFKNRLKKQIQKENILNADGELVNFIVKEISIPLNKLLIIQKNNHSKINTKFPIELDINKLLNERIINYKSYIDSQNLQDINNHFDNKDTKIESIDKILINNELIKILKNNNFVEEVIKKSQFEKNIFDIFDINENKSIIHLIEELELKSLGCISSLYHIYISFLKIVINNSPLNKESSIDTINKLKSKLLNLIKKRHKEIKSLDEMVEVIIPISEYIVNDNEIQNDINEILNSYNNCDNFELKKLAGLYFIQAYLYKLNNNNEKLLEITEEIKKRNILFDTEKNNSLLMKTIINYWNYLVKSINEQKKIVEKGEENILINVGEFEKIFTSIISKLNLLSTNNTFKSILDNISLEVHYIYGIFLYYNKLFNQSEIILKTIVERTDFYNISDNCQYFLSLINEKYVKEEEIIKSPDQIKKNIFLCLSEIYDYQSSYRNSFNCAYKALMLEPENNNKFLLRNEQILETYSNLYFIKHLKYSYLFNKGYKKLYTREEFGLLIYLLNYSFLKKKNYILSEKIIYKIESINTKMNFLTEDDKIKFYFTAGRIFTFLGTYEKAINYYLKIKEIKESTEEDNILLNIIISEISLKTNFNNYLSNLLTLGNSIIVKKTFDNTYNNVLQKLNSLQETIKSENLQRKIDSLANNNI